MTMTVRIEVDEERLRSLVFEYLREQLGEVLLSRDDVMIEVKSKQNYKSEWERAEFRAVVNKIL